MDPENEPGGVPYHGVSCRCTAPTSIRHLLWVMGVMAIDYSLAAQNASSTMRSNIGDRLRSDFQYRPPSSAGESTEASDEQIVRMQPFLVTGEKDHFVAVGRIFRAKRQLELEQKPSLERGASIERGATIGFRPYRDLLKEDARFKTDKAITPTWSLIRF